MLDSAGLPIGPAEQFLAHLAAAQRSPNTVRAYAHDLADLFDWLDQCGRDFRLLTLEQLGEFFEWLRRPRLARSPGVFVLPTAQSALQTTTLARKRASVAGFYRFHARRDQAIPALLGDPIGPRPTGRFTPMLAHTRRGRIDRDAYSPIRLHPVRTPAKTVTDNDFERLLGACRRARDRFLLHVMNDAGLRIGEALGLRHSDLHLRAGEVHVLPRESNTNGARVKGLKDRVVPVGPVVLNAYADYMETEYGTLDSDYVFVNLFRGPVGAALTADAVKDLCRRLRTTTGVEHFSPHMLRHSYATRLLRAKVPIEIVAALLGHSNQQTTMNIYSHLTVEDHRRVLRDAGVLDVAAS